MATIKLTPSAYYLSSNSYLSITNASNMYANTSNTTYATISNSSSSTNSYYLYIRGFNFDAIPTGATINSFSLKVKLRESNGSTSTSYGPVATNNTTSISSGTAPAMTTSATTLTVSTGTYTLDQIVAMG